MPIQFNCSSCQQVLRVGDEFAGRQARCPKCQSVQVVPNADSPPVISEPDPFMPRALPHSEPKPNWEEKPTYNPYTAPSASSYQPQTSYSSGQISPQVIEVGTVFNYAMQVWQNHLGILVGMTAVIFVISYAIGFAIGIGQIAVEAAIGGRDGEAIAAMLGLGANLISNAISIYLTTGQMKVILKLCRGQRAEFVEMFQAGDRFLPVLGLSILSGLILAPAFLLLIVPGVILLLMFWPSYYLVVDGKSTVFDSFGLAKSFTNGNFGTTFVLWLISLLVALAGCLALCIGFLFAGPLISVMWVSAYLMMSGQISSQPLAK
jgi:hypothetical protein